MNCHTAVALVDDLIDNLLTSGESEPLRRHLEVCPVCRATYDDRVWVKEQLGSLPRPERSQSFWDDQADLIIARTIGRQDRPAVTPVRTASQTDLRRSFYRSLLAAAASIAILVASLTLGSSNKYRPVAIFEGTESATVTPALAARIENSHLDLILARDMESVNRATLLIGPPGSVSRFAMMTGFGSLK